MPYPGGRSVILQYSGTGAAATGMTIYEIDGTTRSASNGSQLLATERILLHSLTIALSAVGAGNVLQDVYGTGGATGSAPLVPFAFAAANTLHVHYDEPLALKQGLIPKILTASGTPTISVVAVGSIIKS